MKRRRQARRIAAERRRAQTEQRQWVAVRQREDGRFRALLRAYYSGPSFKTLIALFQDAERRAADVLKRSRFRSRAA